MKISFILYNKKKTVDRICNNEKLGKFMAETTARYMDKFIPMDSGMLAQNFTTEPFVITYTQPYAHRMFDGEGFNFSKDKHPLAQARWDKACKSAHSKDIAKEVEEYLKRI